MPGVQAHLSCGEKEEMSGELYSKRKGKEAASAMAVAVAVATVLLLPLLLLLLLHAGAMRIALAAFACPLFGTRFQF